MAKRRVKVTHKTRLAAVRRAASFLLEKEHGVPQVTHDLRAELERGYAIRSDCWLEHAFEKTRHYVAAAELKSDKDAREARRIIGQLNTQFESIRGACRQWTGRDP
jgi:hypothetical protein